MKRCGQRLQQLGTGTLETSANGDSDVKFLPVLEVNFAGQRNVSIFDGAEFPVHFEIVHQVPPTVAGTDKTNRAAGKTRAAAHDQMRAFAFGAEKFVAADFRTPAGVARAVTRKVRSEQRVKF
jgi:hypothetical protein